MSFTDEFDFLPPELVFQTHRLVETFHNRIGSGPKFRAAAILNSANSPYLNRTARVAVTHFRLTLAAVGFAVVSLVAGLVWSKWVLVGVLVGLIAAFVLYRRWSFALVQIRSIVLATEMLADDFAGWGRASPDAAARAKAWLAASMATPDERLLPLYIPANRRSDFANFLRPGSRPASP